MERRNFLKILPIAALSPRAIKDGVASFELPAGGHFVIVANVDRVDINKLMKYPSDVLPKGATGGYIIPVMGDPDKAIKFYRMEQDGSSTRHDPETKMS